MAEACPRGLSATTEPVLAVRDVVKLNHDPLSPPPPWGGMGLSWTTTPGEVPSNQGHKQTGEEGARPSPPVPVLYATKHTHTKQNSPAGESGKNPGSPRGSIGTLDRGGNQNLGSKSPSCAPPPAGGTHGCRGRIPRHSVGIPPQGPPRGPERMNEHLPHPEKGVAGVSPFFYLAPNYDDPRNYN